MILLTLLISIARRVVPGGLIKGCTWDPIPWSVVSGRECGKHHFRRSCSVICRRLGDVVDDRLEVLDAFIYSSVAFIVLCEICLLTIQLSNFCLEVEKHGLWRVVTVRVILHVVDLHAPLLGVGRSRLDPSNCLGTKLLLVGST